MKWRLPKEQKKGVRRKGVAGGGTVWAGDRVQDKMDD